MVTFLEGLSVSGSGRGGPGSALDFFGELLREGICVSPSGSQQLHSVIFQGGSVTRSCILAKSRHSEL